MKTIRVGSKCVFAIALLLGALARPAQASSITFGFTGTLDVAVGATLTDFAVHAPVSGFFTFESTTAASETGTNFQAYPALTSASITIGSKTYTSLGENSIVVVNDYGGYWDQYKVWWALSGEPALASGRVPIGFQISLNDEVLPADLVNSTDIPTTPPSLALANLGPLVSPVISLVVGDGHQNLEYRGALTSLTLEATTDGEAVPEPGGLLLLGAGLVGVAAVVRSRRR